MADTMSSTRSDVQQMMNDPNASQQQNIPMQPQGGTMGNQGWSQQGSQPKPTQYV